MTEERRGAIALQLLEFSFQNDEVSIKPEHLRLNLDHISEHSGIPADELRELGEWFIERLVPQSSGR